MDKRRSPRYAIDLSALVHPTIGRSWLCMIRDFCEGGMLLVEQDETRRRALPGIRQGETVGIHFSVPAPGKDLHFRLEGKIVRVMDSGVGIKFSGGVEDDAMTALLNYSNSQPLVARTVATKKAAGQGAAAAGGGGNSGLDLEQQPGHAGGMDAKDARKLILGVRKEVARVMPEMNSAFFSYMDEELLKLARDAKTNAEQSDYFAAMSTLEKAKKEVGQSFINEVLDQIDNPRDLRKLLEERRAAEQERKQKQASKVKLSLVSTDEFEDWLAIANIISRSERVYEKYLNELQQRMGLLVDSWGHNEANPLGTSVFCHAFDTAIRRVDLAKDIRQKVYSGFEAKSVPLFRKLYIAVTRMLEESGFFPDLDDDFVVPTPAAKPAAENEATAAPEPEPAPEPEQEQEQEQAPGQEPEAEDDADADLRAQIAELREQLQQRKGGGSAATPEPKPERSKEAVNAPTAGRSSGQREPHPDVPAAPQRPARTKRGDLGEALSSIYSTVRNLIGSDDADDDEEFAFEGVDNVEDVQIDEVQQLLSSLQDEVRSRGSSGQRLPIRRRLQESAISGGRARRIPAEALESLGVVENLVDTIEDDALLSGSSKDWIRQLELTLDKVATTSEDFLDVENPHRSLEVINQLAKLGGSESGGIKRNVDEIVDYINDNFDENPAVFDEALDKLQPLVERQSRAFTGNVQRTVKASEGQQTLVNAQRAVVDEMDQMLAGREIPEVLYKLLMPGWRNLLVNTHLRQGQDSSDWKRHVRSLEQVVHHLDGTVDPSDTESYLPPEALIAEIEQGLDSIAFEPGQRTPLINSLKRVIVDGDDMSAMPMVAVPEAGVATTLGFAEVSAKEAQRQKLREENETDEDWQTCLDRIQHLHVGEWLEIADENEQQQIAIVAWTNEAHSTFVFVNRRGVKTHDMMAEDLATRLQQGQARILEEADIPLTDRASHRMLQNMHNQLTHQATHDELTGLVNRKEFERELTRALGLAKRNNQRHMVAYMDLDQFKVINNSAGHEAGDRLLQDIAGLLRQKLKDVKMVLSRLGGDEFGLLIENCEKDAGVSVVKQLADVVKQHRFEWGSQVYSLTTSAGVVFVDKDMESISTIMQGADSSCFAAKDSGRDRIHVYEADDATMEHRRDIMEFVSQIDRAIKEDRFILNCQKIAPVDENSGEHAHYEILLTVLDDNDEPMPPQDFIVAAETYNRMGAIDRWVIKNAFKFIASNILKLDDLGAFSINISGNSLTEDDFMEFVLEQFNETRLPTSKICFEITETSAIGKLDDAIEFMEKLKIIGVQFSLDDFGTGLSSYSYLRNLPVDYLKIDGIFVKDIKNSPSDYAVVKSINEIGHFMGKKTIAEYVEDDEILAILKEIGVDFAQGYGIERKKPITELL